MSRGVQTDKIFYKIIMIQLGKWLVVIMLLLDIAFLVLHDHPSKYHCMDYILFVTINSWRGCSFVTIYSSVSYMSLINSKSL